MTLAKQDSGRRRRRRIAKAAPVLGAAGLSLSLTNGASAAINRAAPDGLAGLPSHEITLREEEISDVSLATFYVFAKEKSAPVLPRTRLAHACGGCGCSMACGGCWTGTNYTSSVFGDNGNLPQQVKPARKHPRTAKQTPKNPE